MCRLCHSAYLRWIRHAKSGAQLFSHSGCVYNEATRFFRRLCVVSTLGAPPPPGQKQVIYFIPASSHKILLRSSTHLSTALLSGFHFLCHIPIRAINSLVGSKSTRPPTRARWAHRLISFLQLKAPCVTWNFSSGLIFVYASLCQKKERVSSFQTAVCPFHL